MTDREAQADRGFVRRIFVTKSIEHVDLDMRAEFAVFGRRPGLEIDLGRVDAKEGVAGSARTGGSIDRNDAGQQQVRQRLWTKSPLMKP
jgi:hypothetical protein